MLARFMLAIKGTGGATFIVSERFLRMDARVPIAAVLVPWPLGIGTLTLADGSTVQGFVCESAVLGDAEDISHHGGWRNYMASRASGVINP